MRRRERMEEILQKNFQPETMELLDKSNLHRGHSEVGDGEETHFELTIKSKKLSNVSKVESHRKINSLLADEFKSGLHALEIKVLIQKI